MNLKEKLAKEYADRMYYNKLGEWFATSMGFIAGFEKAREMAEERIIEYEGQSAGFLEMGEEEVEE